MYTFQCLKTYFISNNTFNIFTQYVLILSSPIPLSHSPHPQISSNMALSTFMSPSFSLKKKKAPWVLVMLTSGMLTLLLAWSCIGLMLVTIAAASSWVGRPYSVQETALPSPLPILQLLTLKGSPLFSKGRVATHIAHTVSHHEVIAC